MKTAATRKAGLWGAASALLALSAFTPAAVAAPLTGQTISVTGFATPPSAVVGAGAEFSVTAFPRFVFDFADDGSLFVGNTLAGSRVAFSSNSIVDYRFSDTNGTIADITGVDLVGITGGPISGFDASDLSFTADSVRIDLRDTTFFGGQSLQIQISFGDAAVPEPGSFALAGVALLGAFAARRRRR